MVPYYCIVSYYNILFHDAFYDIMLYYIITSSLLSYYCIIIIVMIVTITITVACSHIILCHYHGMLSYILLYDIPLHYILSYYIITLYNTLYRVIDDWGPAHLQSIRWAKGKHSGASELKTMEHEKASYT